MNRVKKEKEWKLLKIDHMRYRSTSNNIFISIFLISISRIQSMEKDNLLRKESTLDPNCLIGSEKWCPRYFMSQKKPGTTILSQ